MPKRIIPMASTKELGWSSTMYWIYSVTVQIACKKGCLTFDSPTFAVQWCCHTVKFQKHEHLFVAFLSRWTTQLEKIIFPTCRNCNNLIAIPSSVEQEGGAQACTANGCNIGSLLILGHYKKWHICTLQIAKVARMTGLQCCNVRNRNKGTG